MRRITVIPALAFLLLAAVACQTQTNAAGNPTLDMSTAKRTLTDVTVGHKLAADGGIAGDQRGSSFKPGEIVYVAFTVTKEAPAGTIVQVNWLGPAGQPIGSDTETVRGGETRMNFASPDTATWTKGQYRAEITVADNKVDGVGFQLVEAGQEDKTAASTPGGVS